VRWKIAPGYYLYRDKISFRSATGDIQTSLGAMPEAEIKDDEFFGKVPVYRNEVSVEVRLKPELTANEQLRLIAKSQGCAESGLCYPPHEQSLSLVLPAQLPVQQAKPVATGTETAKPEPSQPAANKPAGLGLFGNAMPGQDDEILPAEQAFRVSAESPDGLNVRLDWQIAKGTYLYRDEIRLRLKDSQGLSLGELKLPQAVIKENSVRPDGDLGDVAVYEADFGLEVPLLRHQATASKASLEVSYQGCNEVGICYPPQSQSFELELPAVDASKVTQANGTDQQQTSTATSKAGNEEASEQDQIAALLKGGNTWLILLSFFGIGLLLAFTPCVFPMIPILSGIIAGQGKDLTTGKAFMLSLIYVLAMAVAYTVAGVAAGLFGENIQAAFQNPWILGTFALVFVALAFSMFGYYDLQLPSSWQSRISALSNRQQGGTYTGVAIMGLLSALIVGPCVAPPLAGALIYIGQTGDALLGGAALFAMSLGMGAPLIAIGTGAGRFLPRAGGWMDAIKAVFGVMMLGVAILLLERIIDPSIAMLLWGLLLICSSVYMGALRQLPDNASGYDKLWKGLGVAALIYGALMLVGVAANGKDTLQPLRGLSLGGGSGNAASQQSAKLQFQRIKTTADLEREVAKAKAANKGIMLDFYADWCTYCIQFEKYVFSDTRVQARLANSLLLQADVTANDADDKALLGSLGLIAPPAILFWNSSGAEQRNLRIMGYMEVEKFLGHLDKLK
jgi:thiol:disulfide interchange protein DsbD